MTSFSTAVLALTTVMVHGPDEARSEPDGPTATNGRVRGQVVQVTSSEVFVNFGSDRGIAPGDVVTIELSPQPIQVQVLDVWTANARCRLESSHQIPQIGEVATAASRPVSRPRSRYRTRHLAKPRPLDRLLANWQGLSLDRPQLIAYGQESALVTEQLADDNVHGTIAVEYVGLNDPRADQSKRQYHQFALRSDLDIPSLLDGRLTYQHRVRLRADFAPDLDVRPFPLSRSMVRIYRMQVGFHLNGWHGAVGRTLVGMPGASLPGAGLIDGVNIRTGVAKDVQVGAWAGVAPRINDIQPAGGALSFGVYSSVRRELRNRNRTRLSFDGGFLGTTFDGALDRRALSLRASASETDRWLHGQIILDVQAPTRPAIEPSFAFLDAGMRLGNRVRASVRVDHVRSLRTAEALSALPPGYLSTQAFTSVGASASIRVTPRLYMATRAGWRALAEGVGGLTASADLRTQGMWLADDQISLGLDSAFGSYIDGYATRVRYTLPLHRWVDLSARYRFSGYRYRGYIYGDTNVRLYRHQPSLSLDGRLSRRFHGHLDFDALLGTEEVVLATFASLAMRF